MSLLMQPFVFYLNLPETALFMCILNHPVQDLMGVVGTRLCRWVNSEGVAC